ncbi:MAG TPA: ester cyclase [Acidimicrobiales bacterium]|nr:ester cyclase [Acidimicrobiales bacterium]
MTRADVLTLALESEIAGKAADPATLFTKDVTGWSPYASVSSLDEIAEAAAERDTAFSNVAILFRGVDEVGNKAYAEWVIEADHTGLFALGDGAEIEATGRHVVLAGVTVAEFRGDQIRAFRSYFDEVSVLEQLIGD